MNTELLRNVARGLRYRPLGHLVGRAVEVRDLDGIEDALRFALGPDMPGGCCLAGPELQYREWAVAKYGILDLRFSAPRDVLVGDVGHGVPLLRELGFLPSRDAEPQNGVHDDPFFLEMLKGDIDEGRAWLLLFLEGGNPGQLRLPLRVPAGYLPRPFRIMDACVTNASGIWFCKHFYL